ncbi:ABC transporter ATP-binding protein [Paenibacillus contaminans]|uniref:ABC transporter n=1 Tax=Paenibacillus contaminans TaxID=450362 RepID=A0A329MRN2_9BACL|nr:ABC transporter ATP-binding protein [Paenibacillus contaminans]RAV22629.1 ABC transporter [Paenibacillus contaminans]
MKPILSIENLHKTLPDEGNSRLFSGITAQIDAPEIIALLGASGQGKSTLLRILAALDIADKGDIRLHGIPLSEWKPTDWRQKVGYVAQHAVMLSGSVEDNLRTVSMLHRTAFDRPLAERLMSSLGLEGAWGKRAGEMSGGEKQRVSLVRSLLMRPDVLLLDEVTASLDAHSKHAVESLLAEWRRQEGATAIMITHDLAQAAQMSDRIWFMSEGTLLEDDKTDSFFRQPKTDAGRRFIQLPATGEQPCQL